MTDHALCLTPIPRNALQMLTPGLRVMTDGRLWTLLHSGVRAVDTGMVINDDDFGNLGPVYPAGWQPPTPASPLVRELYEMPTTHQWLAWTTPWSWDGRGPYSYHPTEIEARAAAWDRSPQLRKDIA